jgi:hypothetical protein
MRMGEIHLPEPTTLTVRLKGSDAEEIVETLVRLTKDKKIEWQYSRSGRAKAQVGLASFDYDPLARTISVWVVEAGDSIGLTSLGMAAFEELLRPIISEGLEKEREESSARSQKAREAALHMLKKVSDG